MKTSTRIFAIAAFAAVALMAGSCKGGKQAEEYTIDPQIDTIQTDITFQTTMGDIVVRLYNDTPLHRDNMTQLVKKGFYDGILFHRVISGFMVQTGDPYTKDTLLVAQYGQGGPGYTIAAEFRPNHKHKRGALAAARRGDVANPLKESSGSQFYIVHNAEACSHLDGQYTVFGEVVKGMEVVDKIANVKTNFKDMPEKEVRIIKATAVVTRLGEPEAKADSAAKAPAAADTAAAAKPAEAPADTAKAATEVQL